MTTERKQEELLMITKEKNASLTYYQWTADGEAEACRREQVAIKEPTECYHCGLPIPCGLAAKIVTLSGRNSYIMHNYCANRGCFATKQNHYIMNGERKPSFMSTV